MKVADLESDLVSLAGGAYSKGDRVTVKSNAFPNAVLAIESLMDLKLDPNDQPYLVQLHCADGKLARYSNILDL